MPRVKRGNKRRERRKKILSLAKGYFLTKGKLYRSAQESIMRAGRAAAGRVLGGSGRFPTTSRASKTASSSRTHSTEAGGSLLKFAV